MNVDDAVWHMVHGYPGGAPSLAPRLTTIDHTTHKRKPMNAHSLQHKASPTYPTAHFSPSELVDAMEVTGDHGPLEAMALRVGRITLPLPHLMDGDTGSELVQRMAATVREFSEFMVEASKDLQDNRCTGVELRRIQHEGLDAIAAIQQLMALAQSMHEAGTPPHLRVAG